VSAGVRAGVSGAPALKKSRRVQVQVEVKGQEQVQVAMNCGRGVSPGGWGLAQRSSYSVRTGSGSGSGTGSDRDRDRDRDRAEWRSRGQATRAADRGIVSARRSVRHNRSHAATHHVADEEGRRLSGAHLSGRVSPKDGPRRRGVESASIVRRRSSRKEPADVAVRTTRLGG
jgi:hypothetical protein